MKITRIFVNKKGQGLYALSLAEGNDELARLFENWIDANWVAAYFHVNEEVTKDPYFENFTLEQLVVQVQTEARVIIQFIQRGKSNKTKGIKQLKEMFRPLGGAEPYTGHLKLVKASLDKTQYRYPILRIYGLEVSKNTYIITGGVIKLVNEMKDHVDTREQLDRLRDVKQFLIDRKLFKAKDIQTFYYEATIEKDNEEKDVELSN